MNGEWCYFKSHFSSSYCNDLLTKAKNIPIQDAMLGVNADIHQDTNYRRSKIKFIDRRQYPVFQPFFEDLWKMALEANDVYFNFHISKLDFIQLAEYDALYKGEYKLHHDVFWLNGDSKYHRKLTCVVQLSNPNDYKGGQLEITEVSEVPNTTDIQQQGSVIFFPSFLQHQVHPVTEGTRHSIAAWFEGPKWR